MKERLLTILSSNASSSKVNHYIGFPPELSEEKNVRRKLGPARFLAIEEKDDGIFLYRYNDKGECVGDTWHPSIDEAKKQASYEYKDFLGAWKNIPSDVKDIPAFGIAQL